MEVLGDNLAPRWPKMRVGSHLGSIWRAFGVHLVAKMAQGASKWCQDAAVLANLEPKMVNLAPVWEAAWLIFRILSAILAKIAEV